MAFIQLVSFIFLSQVTDCITYEKIMVGVIHGLGVLN